MSSISGSEHLERGARLGYGARGLVYLIVGWLAFLAAFGRGGETTDTKGSLREILQQPAGEALLAAVAVGLVGYSIWRFVQAVRDADDHGRDAKGLVVRAGLAVSGIVHLSLAFFAVSLIFGWGSGSGGGSEDWTARVLAEQHGRWLVLLVGGAIVGAGVAQIWKGWFGTFRRLAADADIMRWLGPVCRFGLTARGVVFLIVAGLVIVAALEFNAGKARGLDGALDALQRQPFGLYLLAIVALGLIAFGIYSIVEAVYRRIGTPEAADTRMGAQT